MKALSMLKRALVIAAMAAPALLIHTAPASAAPNDPCVGIEVVRCLVVITNSDRTAYRVTAYAVDRDAGGDYNVNAVELRIAYASGRVDVYSDPPSDPESDQILSPWYGCHDKPPYNIRLVGDFAWRDPSNPTATLESYSRVVTVCN